MKAHLHKLYALEEIQVEAKRTAWPTYHQSRSGYGGRVPTSIMVKVGGRWRRVYSCCYSNAATLYVGKSIADGLIVGSVDEQ